MSQGDNGPRLEMWAIDRIKPYDKNPRTLPEKAVQKVMGSLKQFGFQKPVVVDEAGVVIAGHVVLKAAQQAGFNRIPVLISNLDAKAAKAYRIADNRTAQETDWLEDLLKDELTALDDDGFDLASIGFDDRELQKLLSDDEEAARAEETPEPPVNPVTQKGDLWVCGDHRVICGDSTSEVDVGRLLLEPVDCILTDPPYCSGGFQEAGKGAGSIGTRQNAQIANDRLSTRGYTALMGNVLGAVNSTILYAFTDWRMWGHLFDVAESKGFGVRAMIVWNKGTPGMGRGWRAQHELILCGAQQSIPFSPAKSQGNVITCKRQANELHPTQKPVDLIATIIDTTDFANVFYDPFGGSGTTLMACEVKHKKARLVEMSPGFVDVIVERWSKFTGLSAIHEASGRTFEDMKAERDANTGSGDREGSRAPSGSGPDPERAQGVSVGSGVAVRRGRRSGRKADQDTGQSHEIAEIGAAESA